MRSLKATKDFVLPTSACWSDPYLGKVKLEPSSWKSQKLFDSRRKHVNWSLMQTSKIVLSFTVAMHVCYCQKEMLIGICQKRAKAAVYT